MLTFLLYYYYYFFLKKNSHSPSNFHFIANVNLNYYKLSMSPPVKKPKLSLQIEKIQIYKKKKLEIYIYISRGGTILSWLMRLHHGDRYYLLYVKPSVHPVKSIRASTNQFCQWKPIETNILYKANIGQTRKPIFALPFLP